MGGDERAARRGVSDVERGDGKRHKPRERVSRGRDRVVRNRCEPVAFGAEQERKRCTFARDHAKKKAPRSSSRARIRHPHSIACVQPSYLNDRDTRAR